MNRSYDRTPDTIRPVTFERAFTKHADGSVLVSFGDTRVLCTAFAEESVPRHRLGKGGWLTAEYDMLPGSTSSRKQRGRNRVDGRSVEIQRLIGRSLRGIIDLNQLGEVTIHLDCDVLQADGGTRTAAITGAYVALHDACMKLKERELLKYWPLIDSVAAISVGVVDGNPVTDLDYREDFAAEVDMNVVMRGNGEFIEVQGTGEKATFKRAQLDSLLELATKSCADLTALQNEALGL